MKWKNSTSLRWNPVLIVEGNGTDLARRGSAQALHQSQEVGLLRRFLAGTVGVFEVLDWKSMQLRPVDHRVELLAQRRAAQRAVFVEVKSRGARLTRLLNS